MSDYCHQEVDLSDAGCAPDPVDPGLPPGPGLLELIYGVLFDPVKTFKRISDSPPVGSAALIFSLVKVLSVLAGGFISTKLVTGSLSVHPVRGTEEILGALLPVAAIFGLVYQYIKWFVYSGLLYLLAELYGSRGKAAGVLASTGLAAVPALLFLPFQVIAAVLGNSGFSGAVSILIWLAVITWGFILVVIGLRETQGLSTGRAVVAVLTPAAGLIVVFIVLVALLASLAGPLSNLFNNMENIGL